MFAEVDAEPNLFRQSLAWMRVLSNKVKFLVTGDVLACCMVSVLCIRSSASVRGNDVIHHTGFGTGLACEKDTGADR